MEEKETGESEDLQCAEQTDSLVSLIISGEEEATQDLSDLGLCSGEDDRLTNGHAAAEEDDGDGGRVTPVRSSGTTTYWSVSEGPGSPFLLSPVPGPSPTPTPRKPRVRRTPSRPGLSRIPGRDHRRYYHEYWRSEYLMDFDPRRHGMICMVCGSSLATLKLSTIKRHIRQKHPDSLLWSAADKEVIRSGWESHLSLEEAGGRGPGALGAEPGEGPLSPPAAAEGMEEEEEEEEGEEEEEETRGVGYATGTPGSSTPRRQQPPPRSPTPSPPPPPPSTAAAVAAANAAANADLLHPDQGGASPLPGPSAETLERYLNDSLHAWFRQEFLMEYQAAAGRLLCMVCARPLPSLHLDHIKRHVLDTHPNSLVLSSEEKHCILQTWAQTHGDGADPLRAFIKSEPDTKDGGGGEAGVDFFPPDTDGVQLGSDARPDPEEGGGAAARDGGGWKGASRPLPRSPRRRALRGGYPWRLRLDYLVAYGPQGRGTFCMVCSQALQEAKVGSFRRHIQDCHPETTTLSREEREAMAEAWTKDPASEDQATPTKLEVDPGDASSLALAPDSSPSPVNNNRTTKMAAVKKEEGGVCGGGGKGGHRHGHYPGKDQRRNYQVRWRLEYLMDYDCRRHGLICMVCGATLATLKVSTIKRHIQQVHPHSLEYGADARQQALLGYSQTALHFVHSDDCFSAHDHGHAAVMAGGAGVFGT